MYKSGSQHAEQVQLTSLREQVSYHCCRGSRQDGYACCSDICRRRETTRARNCEEHELYELNGRKVIAKQVTSLLLLILVSWFVRISGNIASTQTPRLFDCDPDSETSFILIDGVEGDFEDGGLEYCYFKSIFVLVSCACLFPFLLETISILTVIWVSSINNDVLVPIVAGEYVGSGDIFDTVHSANVLARLFTCITVIVAVPKKILELQKQDNIAMPLLLAEIGWKFVVLVLPDMFLTTALFIVSYYVMISSDNPTDILVNLVAVQVLAQLDDVFVKMLFSPRSSCGEKLVQYVSYNHNVERPGYKPFEGYRMKQDEHGMGVEDDACNEINTFHNYSPPK